MYQRTEALYHKSHFSKGMQLQLDRARESWILFHSTHGNTPWYWIGFVTRFRIHHAVRSKKAFRGRNGDSSGIKVLSWPKSLEVTVLMNSMLPNLPDSPNPAPTHIGYMVPSIFFFKCRRDCHLHSHSQYWKKVFYLLQNFILATGEAVPAADLDLPGQLIGLPMRMSLQCPLSRVQRTPLNTFAADLWI